MWLSKGDVFALILFTVYVDGLVVRLQNSGIGCHVGNWYLGYVAFVNDNKNDLTLLAPTRRAHTCRTPLPQADPKNSYGE